MIEFSFTSPAPPDVVLAAVRADARDWRESRTPAAVAKHGVLKVAGEVKGTRVRLFYVRRRTSAGGDPLELRAETVATPEGGTSVRGTCGASAGRGWLPAIFALLGTWVFIRQSAAESVAFFVVAGLLVAVEWWRLHAPGAIDEVEARYLVDRLEEAVRRAGTIPGPADSRIERPSPSAS